MTSSLPDFLKIMFGQNAAEAWLEWGVFHGKQFIRSGAGFAHAVPLPPDNEAVFTSAALLKPGTSRADANVEKVMVLTIDDVGTKIDLPSMELFAPMPTAKVETSAGNYQWQYAIDGGMDPDVYKLLRAHMKASPVYGHSEAIAPSNLIRVPYGVNGKPGKNSWKVVSELTGSGAYAPSQLLLLFKGGSPQGSQGSASTSKPGTVASESLLWSLVKLIPNNKVERDYWVSMAHAIYGASDGQGYDGYETFATWAEGWECGTDDPAANQLLWDGIASSSIGRAWLLREAGLAGDDWLKEEAKVVFDDGVEYEEEPEPAPIVLPAATLTRKLPRRGWLYGKRLIRGYLSSTIAAGGTGKSSLTMAEAVSMVTGKDLLKVGDDKMPKVPLRVLIWNGEDPYEELERRLQAICKYYSINEADLGSRLWMQSGRDHPLHEKKDIQRFKALIKAIRADVVILDPFVSTHRVSENDNVAIDAIAKGWSGIAEECFCAIDLVHHIRKPAGGNGKAVDLTVDDARGASALVNASRYARVLSPMGADLAAQYRIVNRKEYFANQRDATKANMVPGMVGTDWFHFANVELDNGDASEPGDMVGVVEPWEPGIPIAEDVDKIIAAQEGIAKGSWRASSQSKEWVGLPVAEALGLGSTDPVVKGVLKEWLRKGWLKSYKALDAARHEREFVGVGNVPAKQVFDD